MMKIKTAIVGFGYSASTLHVPLLQSVASIEISAVVSSRPKDVQRALPGVRCFTSVEELLSVDDISLVVITTPNDTHCDIALRCLAAGKHVVCDKPLAVSAAEVQAMIEAADKHQRLLSVFHNRRWDGDFLTVKKLLREGVLGQVRVVRTHFDRFRPEVRSRWREQAGSGTGIWFDLGPHMVDQALQLFGQPHSISGCLRRLRPDSPSADYFSVTLHYPSTEVLLHSSPYCMGDTLRFDVQGDEARFLKFGLDRQESALKMGIHPMDDNWLSNIQEPKARRVTEHSQAEMGLEKGNYLAYYSAVAAAILKNAPNPVTAQEVLPVIDIVERVQSVCQEALDRTGLAFVDLLVAEQKRL